MRVNESMRRQPQLLCLAICCAMLSLFTASPSGSAEAKPKRDCRTLGKTVAANAQARVFYRIPSGGGGRKYYACDVRHRRTRSIGTAGGPGDGISPSIALAGRHVAYEDITCERDGNCSGTVYRLNVVSNREQTVAVMDRAAPPATDLEMTSSLVVYWIRRTAEGYGVTRATPGDVRTLDNGPGVEPRSLAVAWRRAYWLVDGAPRSAAE